MDLYDETFVVARRIVAATREADPDLFEVLVDVSLDAGSPVGAVENAIAIVVESGFVLPSEARRDVEWIVALAPQKLDVLAASLRAAA